MRKTRAAREVSHLGRLGLEGYAHLENLLLTFRNLDRVLARLTAPKNYDAGCPL